MSYTANDIQTLSFRDAIRLRIVLLNSNFLPKTLEFSYELSTC